MKESLHQALDCNLFTKLSDRILFFDGDTVIRPDQIEEFLNVDMRGQLAVTEVTKDIDLYNQFADQPITEKNDFRQLDFTWNIPEEYLNLDIDGYVIKRFREEVAKNPEYFNSDVEEQYQQRCYNELQAYRDLDLYPILRAVIYIINTLRSNEIVWGVGRGSSVSSYVLYLVGVHDVDSVYFDLDYTDFLRKSGDDI